jgi:hypothetical protein
LGLLWLLDWRVMVGREIGPESELRTLSLMPIWRVAVAVAG